MTALNGVRANLAPLDLVLDKLRELGPVKQSGSRWLAACPAHNGQHPNLQVGTGSDGRVLVTCWSRDCSYADVMTALGLDPRQGFPDGDRQPTWGPNATRRHPYRTNGAPFAWTERQRAGDAKFKPRQLDGTAASSKPYKLTLFNADLLDERPDDEVLLLEGEKDCDTAELLLGALAVTNSHGARSFGEVHARQLAGRKVRVILDRDTAGRERLEVLRQAGLWEMASVVGVFEPPEPHKDLTDHLTADGTLDDLVPVEVPPTEFEAAVAAFETELLDRDQLAQLPPASPLIPGVLSRRTYALLTGRDGTYKTLLALAWCCCLATGTPWHTRPVEKVRVLYLIGEGAWDFDARIAAWEDETGVRVSRDQLVTLPRVPNMFRGKELAVLLEVIRRGRFGLVVVDTLRRASTGADMNGSDMAEVVDSLEAIKRATDDGTVLVLAHTDKGDNDSRGFSGVEDDADTVWHSRREQKAAPAVVTNEKMRAGPDGATFTLSPRPVGLSVVLDLLAEYGHDHRPAAARVTPTALRILKLLSQPGYEKGASAPDLAATAGLSRQRISDAMSELIGSGQVSRTGARGQYIYTACPTLSGQAKLL